MYFITPTDITDDLLFGTDVPEDDYDEWVEGTAYAVNDIVMVATSTADIHKIYQCIGSISAGLTADILDEPCLNFTDNSWTDASFSPASTSISPAGQFKFDSSTGQLAERRVTLASPPDTFTIEMHTYFDAIGSVAGQDYFVLTYYNTTWRLQIRFSSDGLTIFKAGGTTTEVGTDIVKYNTTAEWQQWRFEVTKTVEASATVEVFLKNADDTEFTSQGTVDCDYASGGTDGLLSLIQYGVANNDRISHIHYIRMATGLGRIATTDNSPHLDTTNWLEVSPTNRWKPFDVQLGTQASQATSLTYVLSPGAIDSVALLALESSSVQIIEIDEDDDLVTNGQAWTDATGTTQPTGWDKVGTPTDFTIDNGALKITVDGAGEGISQTITVAAATEYQLVGLYKNTTGDVAQYAVYDVDNSGDILATTDLADSEAFSALSYVFTTPAGCTSVKISLLGKTAGDIVWFDSIVLAPTGYSETVTTGLARTDVVETNLPSYTNALLTVTVNYSGGTAKIGELIVGTKTALGTTRPEPQVGIKDYSTKAVDTYGHYSIVERSFAKRLSCLMKIDNDDVDEVFRQLALCRATEKVWIADEDYSCLIVYGFYKEFNIVLKYPQFSVCSLEVEGLT